MTRSLKLFLLSCIMLLCGVIASPLYGQSRTVSGVVQDDNGDPLYGAFVVEKGTTNGVSTDIDGKFSIVAPADAVLEFQFIGYLTQEIQLTASEQLLLVQMETDANLMEEVVVTAFATQKKINVTGAISAVNGTDLVASPVANISNALIGNTPGVSGLQTSGEPGRNQSNIYVRGISTYGESTPLIIIDGVEQASEQAFSAFNAMDANEIASISVLKDASSTAVYGVRGANGVIIVTTKRGQVGKPVISASANFGLTSASNLQEGTTAYEYALFRNEAIRNEQNAYAGNEGLSAYIYDDYDLWKFKNNRDFTPQEVDAMTHLSDAQKEQLKNSPALYYASRNLYKEQFSKVAPQYQANVNISGGTDKVKYFVSFGYFRQEGITNAVEYYGSNTGSVFNRYNFRSNFDINVTDNLKITINSAGQFGETTGPGNSADPYDLSSRYKIIMQYIYDANPFISPGIVDGKLIRGFAGISGSAQNPLSGKTNSSIGEQNALYNLLISGSGTIFNSLLDNSIKLEHTMDYLLPNLKAYATVSYQDNYNRYVKYTPSIPSYTVQRNAENPNILEFFGGSMGSGSFDSWGYSNWNKFYVDAGMDWFESYGKHNVSALLLAKASKYTMPSDSYNVASGIMGFVGRVTYNYDDRYMAEVNVGYNGTEQFAEGKRFGLFPAISAGWVPTAEEWFPKNEIFTFMKLRASYGEVGNDRLGAARRYYYLPNTYYLNQTGYYLGNSDGSSANTYFSGATEGVLGNPDITWERARKYDVGVETKFFSDRLSVDFDYFYEKRDNILTTLGTIPAIYGVSSNAVPPANVGITENKGYELVLGWQDTVGDFTYSIGGDLSWSRNKIIFKAEANNPYPWMNQTGHAIGQRFGLVSDGLFNTQDELANRPYNTYTSNQATLGDIRYKDLDGDGLINQNDVAPIGFPNYAQYHFNVKLHLAWKGLDLRMLFTGSANGSYYLNSGYTIPFFKNAGNAWKWQYDGRWTAEKYAAGEKITYPRAAYAATSSHNNYLTSDYWMVSTNHFKLKNVELGYTFNVKKGVLSQLNVQSLRLFMNANNIYTFKNALTPYGIDPETTDGSTYLYPLTRVFTFGVNLRF
ncbi:MAG: TonB-dependent receptor [Bacteroidales bacterium]|nr:TonB-dependent receptor [Bacteroidales bacterium]MBO5862334.1 TonB-dependent receptor [Bacteroidales bacterium]MBO5979964.1 TonB-dependent receptor [Bacteroidales bacterium]